MSDEERANFLFDLKVKAIAGFLKNGEQGVKHKADLLDWLRTEVREAKDE